MDAIRFRFLLPAVAALLVAGCAATPETESRRQFRDAQIDAILARPWVDSAESGAMKRCLNDTEYRTFRALDDRHLLFEGRRDRLWVNTLRHRCPDLRYGDILVVRSFSSFRMCEMDRFGVADWFDWPWYRRWPWRWGTPWHTGMTCVLGEFQPVTEEQVAEIRAVLRSR